MGNLRGKSGIEEKLDEDLKVQTFLSFFSSSSSFLITSLLLFTCPELVFHTSYSLGSIGIFLSVPQTQ